MAKKTIIAVIVLIVALGLIFWYQQSRKDNDNSDQTELSISVFNKSKNVDGTSVTASPKDELVYTLTVQNTSDEVISGYVVETNIEDISELATLTDVQGANYNDSNHSLMWTPLDVPANGSIEKQFTVRVKDTLPTDSDFMITTTYSNEVIVSVAQPQVAVNPTPTPAAKPTPTPTAPFTAPTSGPSAWFAFILAMAFTAGIILYRAAKRMSV